MRIRKEARNFTGSIVALLGVCCKVAIELRDLRRDSSQYSLLKQQMTSALR